MQEFAVVTAMATTLVLLLAGTVLAARRWLVPTGDVSLLLNGRYRLTAARGEKLLWALAANDVFLPAACGGRGSCGQCRLRVVTGADRPLPTELSLISRREAAAGERLACMVTVLQDMELRVAEHLLQASTMTCRVRSAVDITTFLKEFVLELPPDSDFRCQAGDYVLVEAPPGRTRFADFALSGEHRTAWQRLGLLSLEVNRRQAETRAYSLASAPRERDVIRLVVRIATPPAGLSRKVPPGSVSSWLYGLVPGDAVRVTGPYGDFHARDTDNEMVLIGGGAGIAPLRSILHDQLGEARNNRRISLWYGVRTADDLCFVDEFDALAREHPNFTWHVALSDGRDESAPGYRGLVHDVLREEFLDRHAAPADAEYYLCGPPLMSSAVIALLEDRGVPADHILCDEFDT